MAVAAKAIADTAIGWPPPVVWLGGTTAAQFMDRAPRLFKLHEILRLPRMGSVRKLMRKVGT